MFTPQNALVFAAGCIVGKEIVEQMFHLRNETVMYHCRPLKRVQITARQNPVVIEYLGEKYVLPPYKYVLKTTPSGATVEPRTGEYVSPTYVISTELEHNPDKWDLVTHDTFVWTERERELYRELTGNKYAPLESGLVQWEFKGGFASYPLLKQ